MQAQELRCGLSSCGAGSVVVVQAQELLVLGLHCCTGYSLVVIHGLIVTASLVVVHGLPKHRLNSCGARA